MNLTLIISYLKNKITEPRKISPQERLLRVIRKYPGGWAVFNNIVSSGGQLYQSQLDVALRHSEKSSVTEQKLENMEERYERNLSSLSLADLSDYGKGLVSFLGLKLVKKSNLSPLYLLESFE